MKKSASLLSAFTFLLLLYGIGIWNLLTPDRTFSENENRFLTAAPAFSPGELFFGDYTGSLETYATDQFAGRDTWVSVKAGVEKWIRKAKSNGVYFAKDDYLIESFETVNREQYRKNLGYAESFHRALDQMDIKLTTLLVPTASYILEDKLPSFAPETSQKELLAEAQSFLPDLTDVSDTLYRHREEAVYYRTDHHWTSLGAFYAYEAYCRAKGLDAPSFETYDREILSDSFYGTTWSKASLYSIPPDSIEAFQPKTRPALSVLYESETSDSIYVPAYLEKKDQYSVFLGQNQPLIQITTDTGNGRRLLLVKDSYANCFVQFLLTDYEEIHILDPRFYRSSYTDYVKEQGITDALLLFNLKGFSEETSLYFLGQ